MNARPPTANDAPLREGIDALRDLDPDYDVASGAARFEASLGATPKAPSGGSLRSLRIVTALLIVAGTVAGTAAVVAWMGRDPEPIATRAVEAPTQPAAEVEPDARPAPPPAPVVPIALAATPTPAPAEARALASTEPKPAPAPVRGESRPRTRPHPGAPATPASDDAPAGADVDDALAREMALLNAARKQVGAGEARTALGSITTARASFPALRFDEEWDALEILALAGAGRLDDARRLARPFLAGHTGGRFNASIERAIGPASEIPEVE
jgi:hypothetical protein